MKILSKISPTDCLIFFSLNYHIFYVTQCSADKSNLINMLHHSNGQCSFNNSIIFILLIALSTRICKFAISFFFCTCFLSSVSLSVHLEVLENYKNEEVGLLESVNHDLPLLHRHSQEGHKSLYP